VRAFVVGLVLLHGPNGHEILVNPATVTSMHSAIEGKPNELLTDAVRCLINTSDGKFLSVIETCETVRELMEGKP
jgi:hypothetical protein